MIWNTTLQLYKSHSDVCISYLLKQYVCTWIVCSYSYISSEDIKGLYCMPVVGCMNVITLKDVFHCYKQDMTWSLVYAKVTSIHSQLSPGLYFL